VVSNHQFFVASRAYAQKRADVVSAVLSEVAGVDDWAKSHVKEAAAALQPQIGLDVPTLELALSRGGYGVKPVTDTVMGEQQNIADTFYNLRLIPKHINVRDATLPEARAQAKP